MENSLKECEKKVSVISVDETQLCSHVAEVVRQSVEDTLNGLLDPEADELCKAQKYERNLERATHGQVIMSAIFRQHQGKSI